MLMIMSNNMISQLEAVITKYNFDYRYKITNSITENDISSMISLIEKVQIIICEETIFTNLSLVLTLEKYFINTNIIILCYSKLSCEYLESNGFLNYIYLHKEINLEQKLIDQIKQPKIKKSTVENKENNLILAISLDKYCGLSKLLYQIFKKQTIFKIQSFDLNKKNTIKKVNLKDISKIEFDGTFKIIDFGMIDLEQLSWLMDNQQLFTKIIIMHTKNKYLYQSDEYQSKLELIECKRHDCLILDPQLSQLKVVDYIQNRENKRSIQKYVQSCDPSIFINVTKKKRNSKLFKLRRT